MTKRKDGLLVLHFHTTKLIFVLAVQVATMIGMKKALLFLEKYQLEIKCFYSAFRMVQETGNHLG